MQNVEIVEELRRVLGSEQTTNSEASDESDDGKNDETPSAEVVEDLSGDSLVVADSGADAASTEGTDLLYAFGN